MAGFFHIMAFRPLSFRVRDGESCAVTVLPTRRIHPAWWVAAVTFLALVGAAGFRAVPGVLMEPLHDRVRLVDLDDLGGRRPSTWRCTG